MKSFQALRDVESQINQQLVRVGLDGVFPKQNVRTEVLNSLIDDVKIGRFWRRTSRLRSQRKQRDTAGQLNGIGQFRKRGMVHHFLYLINNSYRVQNNSDNYYRRRRRRSSRRRRRFEVVAIKENSLFLSLSLSLRVCSSFFSGTKERHKKKNFSFSSLFEKKKRSRSRNQEKKKLESLSSLFERTRAQKVTSLNHRSRRRRRISSTPSFSSPSSCSFSFTIPFVSLGAKKKKERGS